AITLRKIYDSQGSSVFYNKTVHAVEALEAGLKSAKRVVAYLEVLENSNNVSNNDIDPIDFLLNLKDILPLPRDEKHKEYFALFGKDFKDHRRETWLRVMSKPYKAKVDGNIVTMPGRFLYIEIQDPSGRVKARLRGDDIRINGIPIEKLDRTVSPRSIFDGSFVYSPVDTSTPRLGVETGVAIPLGKNKRYTVEQFLPTADRIATTRENLKFVTNSETDTNNITHTSFSNNRGETWSETFSEPDLDNPHRWLLEKQLPDGRVERYYNYETNFNAAAARHSAGMVLVYDQNGDLLEIRTLLEIDAYGRERYLIQTVRETRGWVQSLFGQKIKSWVDGFVPDRLKRLGEVSRDTPDWVQILRTSILEQVEKGMIFGDIKVLSDLLRNKSGLLRYLPPSLHPDSITVLKETIKSFDIDSHLYYEEDPDQNERTYMDLKRARQVEADTTQVLSFKRFTVAADDHTRNWDGTEGKAFVFYHIETDDTSDGFLEEMIERSVNTRASYSSSLNSVALPKLTKELMMQALLRNLEEELPQHGDVDTNKKGAALVQALAQSLPRTELKSLLRQLLGKDLPNQTVVDAIQKALIEQAADPENKKLIDPSTNLADILSIYQETFLDGSMRLPEWEIRHLTYKDPGQNNQWGEPTTAISPDYVINPERALYYDYINGSEKVRTVLRPDPHGRFYLDTGTTRSPPFPQGYPIEIGKPLLERASPKMHVDASGNISYEVEPLQLHTPQGTQNNVVWSQRSVSAETLGPDFLLDTYTQLRSGEWEHPREDARGRANEVYTHTTNPALQGIPPTNIIPLPDENTVWRKVQKTNQEDMLWDDHFRRWLNKVTNSYQDGAFDERRGLSNLNTRTGETDYEVNQFHGFWNFPPEDIRKIELALRGLGPNTVLLNDGTLRIKRDDIKKLVSEPYNTFHVRNSRDLLEGMQMEPSKKLISDRDLLAMRHIRAITGEKFPMPRLGWRMGTSPDQRDIAVADFDTRETINNHRGIRIGLNRKSLVREGATGALVATLGSDGEREGSVLTRAPHLFENPFGRLSEPMRLRTKIKGNVRNNNDVPLTEEIVIYEDDQKDVPPPSSLIAPFMTKDDYNRTREGIYKLADRDINNPPPGISEIGRTVYELGQNNERVLVLNSINGRNKIMEARDQKHRPVVEVTSHYPKFFPIVDSIGGQGRIWSSLFLKADSLTTSAEFNLSRYVWDKLHVILHEVIPSGYEPDFHPSFGLDRLDVASTMLMLPGCTGEG
ncbi:hypothetical protein BVX98_07540, partial [bacterium F11]